jgi:hypothetical protein
MRRPHERIQTAVHDSSRMLGGLAGAGYGAEFGMEVRSIEGTVGTVVGGSIGGSIGADVVDGIEELFWMRTWLDGLFRKGRPRTADENPLESRSELSPEERAVLLVGILDDPTAREDEKYDAAMYMEDFPGPLVESCLIRTIRAEDFSSVLAQHCAASLAGIWAQQDRIDRDFFAELHGPASREVLGILGARAPHLIPTKDSEG